MEARGKSRTRVLGSHGLHLRLARRLLEAFTRFENLHQELRVREGVCLLHRVAVKFELRRRLRP